MPGLAPFRLETGGSFGELTVFGSPAEPDTRTLNCSWPALRGLGAHLEGTAFGGGSSRAPGGRTPWNADSLAAGLRAVLAAEPTTGEVVLPAYGATDGAPLVDLSDREALWAALDADGAC